MLGMVLLAIIIGVLYARRRRFKRDVRAGARADVQRLFARESDLRPYRSVREGRIWRRTL